VVIIGLGPIGLMVTRFKKVQLRVSHAIPNRYFPMVLNLLACRVVTLGLLVSRLFSLDGYGSAFRTLTDPWQVAVKVILIP
jgi:threonine dehydrogenase-like Zn-dependent dehydrogenase